MQEQPRLFWLTGLNLAKSSKQGTHIESSTTQILSCFCCILFTKSLEFKRDGKQHVLCGYKQTLYWIFKKHTTIIFCKHWEHCTLLTLWNMGWKCISNILVAEKWVNLMSIVQILVISLATVVSTKRASNYPATLQPHFRLILHNEVVFCPQICTVLGSFVKRSNLSQNPESLEGSYKNAKRNKHKTKIAADEKIKYFMVNIGKGKKNKRKTGLCGCNDGLKHITLCISQAGFKFLSRFMSILS